MHIDNRRNIENMACQVNANTLQKMAQIDVIPLVGHFRLTIKFPEISEARRVIDSHQRRFSKPSQSVDRHLVYVCMWRLPK